MPFLNVTNLISQIHVELVPFVLQVASGNPPQASAKAIARARVRLLERVRQWETDAQLRCWLHSRALLPSWSVLELAFLGTHSFLLTAQPDNKPALSMAAEILCCPTQLNVTRLVLRGPILAP